MNLLLEVQYSDHCLIVHIALKVFPLSSRILHLEAWCGDLFVYRNGIEFSGRHWTFNATQERMPFSIHNAQWTWSQKSILILIKSVSLTLYWVPSNGLSRRETHVYTFFWLYTLQGIVLEICILNYQIFSTCHNVRFIALYHSSCSVLSYTQYRFLLKKNMN